MNKKRVLFSLVAVAIAGGVGAGVWFWRNNDSLPPGIVMGNGRIEAERIDIAPKFPGRVKEVLVDEGDMVKAGEVLVKMDTATLLAQLREARAAVWKASEQLNQSTALLHQREGELKFAELELQRAEKLSEKGFAAQERLERRRTELQTARAAVRSAKAQVALANAGLEAAQANVERLETELADHTLTAPRDGRVQYRLAEPGEVLAAGARVLTLIDLTDVYMTIYLPTHYAGRVLLGSEARIKVDAAPELVIPAKVSFVASEAQFTPKYVETENERAKLMFRVKLQIPPELLKKHASAVKTGVPGVGYVKVSPETNWPEWLHVRLPE